jgi:lysyl-tRNA synthetase, class I
MSRPLTLDPALIEAAQTANAWPFEEARKLVERLKRTGKKEALFETGYGPSGLPHIGTFGEVARTSMVRHAFRVLTGDTIPTRLVATWTACARCRTTFRTRSSWPRRSASR